MTMANRLEWISIKDQLPINSDDVFVTDGKGNIQQYYFVGLHTVESAAHWGADVGSQFWKRIHDPIVGKWINSECITHWLPLSALIETLPNNYATTKLDEVVQIQIGGSGNTQNIS